MEHLILNVVVVIIGFGLMSAATWSILHFRHPRTPPLFEALPEQKDTFRRGAVAQAQGQPRRPPAGISRENRVWWRGGFYEAEIRGAEYAIGLVTVPPAEGDER